jgi:hypothetical protein
MGLENPRPPNPTHLLCPASSMWTKIWQTTHTLMPYLHKQQSKQTWLTQTNHHFNWFPYQLAPPYQISNNFKGPLLHIIHSISRTIEDGRDPKTLNPGPSCIFALQLEYFCSISHSPTLPACNEESYERLFLTLAKACCLVGDSVVDTGRLWKHKPHDQSCHLTYISRQCTMNYNCSNAIWQEDSEQQDWRRKTILLNYQNVIAPRSG